MEEFSQIHTMSINKIHIGQSQNTHIITVAMLMHIRRRKPWHTEVPFTYAKQLNYISNQKPA